MQAFFFDLDGTLIDSAPDILAITARMAKEHNKPLPAADYMRAGVSGGVALVLSRIFGVPRTDPFIEQLRQEFLAEFVHCTYEKTKLFHGIEAVLGCLNQYAIPWGIITNKSRQLSEQVIAVLPPLQTHHVLICGDDIPQAKPHPQGLQQAASHTKSDPAHCWYLGDSHNDMLAAQAATMRPLLANWGYIAETDTPQEWGAEQVFDRVEELHQSIKRALEGST